MKLISRREVLLSSAATLVPPDEKARKLKVVVTGGHPGDPEYGCGGTIARYTDRGHRVVLLYLNRGEIDCGAGSNGPEGMRVREAEKACGILRAQPAFADQCDGHAIVDNTHYNDFLRLIQAEAPDVLFTHWPIDGHRDHRAISMLAYDAWRRMKRTFSFYYYEVSDGEDTLMFSPTDYVDITAVEARKRAACYAHASQTPDRYYAMQSAVTRFRGMESGFNQAEGFIRHVESRGRLVTMTRQAVA
ncbi:MAG: PIG-L family deacetylase [Bryobacteraceae bacterium]